MTIHTLDAAKQARDIGFSRVVLSRECSREEIKLITEQAGVETEVFVHGALCMCYSGQCYLCLLYTSVRSMPMAPSGAVIRMASTATESTSCPHGRPIDSGTEPMAACTVAFGR